MEGVGGAGLLDGGFGEGEEAVLQQERGEIGERAAAGAQKVGHMAEVDVGGEIGFSGEVKGGNLGVAVEGLQRVDGCWLRVVGGGEGVAVIDEQGGLKVGELCEFGQPSIHGGAVFVGDAGIRVGEGEGGVVQRDGAFGGACELADGEGIEEFVGDKEGWRLDVGG